MAARLCSASVLLQFCIPAGQSTFLSLLFIFHSAPKCTRKECEGVGRGETHLPVISKWHYFFPASNVPGCVSSFYSMPHSGFTFYFFWVFLVCAQAPFSVTEVLYCWCPESAPTEGGLHIHNGQACVVQQGSYCVPYLICLLCDTRWTLFPFCRLGSREIKCWVRFAGLVWASTPGFLPWCQHRSWQPLFLHKGVMRCKNHCYLLLCPGFPQT